MSQTKNNAGCFIGALAGAAATILSGVGLIVLLFVLAATRSGDEMVITGPKIAHINLEGLITSAGDFGFGGTGQSMVERLKAELKQAVEDEDTKAIVLRINSPGGEVTASDTIYHAIKQANAKKPVVVFMDSVAASGGYYAACGATEIFANETTMTGSIGVIISSVSYHELLGKVGVEPQVFKSGQFKDLLSGMREIDPEEAALVQDMVMETYDKFVGIVAEARDLPEAKLRKDIADGRIFSGAKAKDVGLVDTTGYLEDAYDRARELGKSPEAKVWKIRTPVSVFEAFGMVKNPAPPQNRIEIDIADRILPRLQPGMVYLLPSTWVH